MHTDIYLFLGCFFLGYEIIQWDFKFSRRRVWCSELSSGLYCRVKWLSTIILHGTIIQKTTLNIKSYSSGKHTKIVYILFILYIFILTFQQWIQKASSESADYPPGDHLGKRTEWTMNTVQNSSYKLVLKVAVT
jgi:uncharacterized membrane protein YkvI